MKVKNEAVIAKSEKTGAKLFHNTYLRKCISLRFFNPHLSQNAAKRPPVSHIFSCCQMLFTERLIITQGGSDITNSNALHYLAHDRVVNQSCSGNECIQSPEKLSRPDIKSQTLPHECRASW